jgi:S-phase kinase-associated protein 1
MSDSVHKVKFITKDDTPENGVLVPKDVALMSKTIEEMIKDDDDDIAVVPVPDVTQNVLNKVLEFCIKHAKDPMPKIERPIKSTDMKVIMKDSLWDAEYIDGLGDEMLFEVILAANYLAIESLIDLGCAKVASILKNRTPKEIRERFNINEPTREEEEAVLKDNSWVFEIQPPDMSSSR